MSRLILALIACVLCVSSIRASSIRAEEPSAAKIEFFEKRIRPVLVRECYECHASTVRSIKGGLLLDSRPAMLEGGDSGPSVVPGDPDESLLLGALRYEHLEMPPKGQLSDKVIADFEKWITDGAADPRTKLVRPNRPKIDSPQGDDRFWSFEPVHRQPLPMVKDRDWIENRIDTFVLHRMEQAGLAPTAQADKRMFVRRLSYDLRGLPPTPDEVKTFVNDNSPQAYDDLIQRFLASPAFGERVARMWMDVARYAEDQAHIVGGNKSLTYPNAYIYRDWLIDALNRDLAFDEFVVQQLAADLADAQDLASHAALGFIGLGPKYYRRNSPAVMADEWEDRVDTVSRGLLGLTVACARCHDHKFDPIGTKDYYALAGVFASTEMYNRPLDAKDHTAGNSKDPSKSMHIIRDAKPQDLQVHIRGDATNKGDVAKRQFLTVLSKDEPTPFKTGSGRLELAREIVSRDNPLAARVFVNRVWMQLIGKGIVGTPSNFGELGERPTHPQLLDDLAARFMENGWSIKWLCREIVSSATYRQSSFGSKESVATDPSNRWLSRMNRHRLSAESWRDGLLSAAGVMNRQIGGKSIDPQDAKEHRRTVYSEISRLELNPMLTMFDFPDPNAHAASRADTITPLQKLFIMNNPFVIRRAEEFAARLIQRETSAESRIVLAYEILFARSPNDAELAVAQEFLGDCGDDRDAWTQYAHVLLASNEMMFVD